MEWLIILIGIVTIFAILGGAGKGSGSEYREPPDYEDDPPLPIGASQEAINAFDRKRRKE